VLGKNIEGNFKKTKKKNKKIFFFPLLIPLQFIYYKEKFFFSNYLLY
jgi:hypothetical protein